MIEIGPSGWRLRGHSDSKMNGEERNSDSPNCTLSEFLVSAMGGSSCGFTLIGAYLGEKYHPHSLLLDICTCIYVYSAGIWSL